MWVPLSFGNAEIPNHHPKHFYPGGAYVDWVGTTWYSRYSASSACTPSTASRVAPQALRLRRVGRVGGRRAELRQAVLRLPDVSCPQVRMAVYYRSASLKPEFRLSNHPASRAALRRAVRWPRLTGVAP